MRWLGQFFLSPKGLHFETEGVRWGLEDSYLPLGNWTACLSEQYQGPLSPHWWQPSVRLPLLDPLD